MSITLPGTGDIRSNSVTAAGTVITIPAGRTFAGRVTLSVAVIDSRVVNPTVTFNGGGTGAEPAAGTVVQRIIVGANSSTSPGNGIVQTEIMVRAGSANATLDFAPGGTAGAACAINGILI